MTNDPIVEDVYRARQAILDKCGGDLRVWMRRLMLAESRNADRVVTMEEVEERRRTATGAIPTRR